MILTDALILGGGNGTRFSESNTGDSENLNPKQFSLINEIPVFVHAIRSIELLGCIRNFILAVPEAHLKLAELQIQKYLSPETQKKTHLISGGKKRQDSSRLALQKIDSFEIPPTRILIHDACRPFFSTQFLNNIKKHLADRSYGVWIPAVPVVETLKKVENQEVKETIDRNLIHRVQTPQIFEYSVIRPLAEQIRNEENYNFTDDASLCEFYGIPVGVFTGDVRNIKLTYPFELESLTRIMSDYKKETLKCEPASASISIG